MADLKIDCLQAYEDFQAIHSDWDAIISSLGDSASVFGSFSWHDCWWRHYGRGARLFVLVIRKSRDIIGIVPFLQRKSLSHWMPTKIIGFMENLNSLHNDFLFVPEYRESAFRALMTYLWKSREFWDMIEINNIAMESPNYDVIVRLFEEMRIQWRQQPTVDSPYIKIDGNWERYIANRSARTRKTLRNIQNNLLKAGECRISRVQTWNEYQAVKDDVYLVARNSWTERIRDSIASPGNVGFFEDLARVGSENGWLSLWILRLDGNAIAFEFHLRAFGKTHAMRASYSSDFERLSPGTYLQVKIIEELFQHPEGVGKYDFGGSKDEYKRKWSDDVRRHCAISIFNDRVYSKALAFHETRAIPMLRTIRDRVKGVNDGTVEKS